ncbi:MAG: hypothetical protein QJR07_00490 [Acetobacteraceae bacterium]|nr:hypothetical protein [Acetobacteraceae bacterium]
MRRTATLPLILLLLAAPARAQQVEEIGTWRLACSTDRMTDRTSCLLRLREWVEPPGTGMPGLALEVTERGGRLVPAVTSRDLTLEGAARGLLALTGTAQLRLPPHRLFEMPCGLEGWSLVCAPRQEDAARAEQELPQADRVLVRMLGMAGSGGPAAEPVELRLSGTAAALARYRQAVPPSAAAPEPPGLDGRELLQRLLRLLDP